MGDHYVPQYYLRGFCEPSTPGTISRYEKGSSKIITTGLKNVAQETGFYSKEMEEFLSAEIEGPANPVLDKIRKHQPITTEDKFVLSTYMTTMLKRVPQSRVRLKQSAPEVIESVFGKLDEELAGLLDANPSKSEIIERRREEAKRLREQYEKSVPKDIWLQLILPQTAPRVLAALNAMTWRFLVYDKDSTFLTSDNPVFFHSGIGVGHPNSEVTFPISRDVVMWATWRRDLQEGFFPANKRVVREINHRTASAATRYVFFSREEKWVVNLANRKKFTLHRMV